MPHRGVGGVERGVWMEVGRAGMGGVGAGGSCWVVPSTFCTSSLLQCEWPL